MSEQRSLLVDLYELTMAECYRRYKPDTVATFELFVRELPANRSFLLCAGLEDVISFVQGLCFQPDDIEYLRSRRMFSEEFLGHLSRLSFTGDIWAMPEGTVFFPNEPVIRVTAPVIEAQLVESFLLSTINLQTMIASKAARVVLAAKGRPVFDFSLRRTHGPAAALSVARSSYIAGCAGTSNVLAGKVYGMPVAGTMAHSFVMSFANELESFQAYTRTFADTSVLLVDTYDTRKGLANAVKAGLALAQAGHRLAGVRIDSGDIPALSKLARRMFDAAGLTQVKVVASGNLDEFAIEELLKQGACVDSFGVGTQMGTSFDAPALDAIYKLVEVSQANGELLPTMKLSAAKVTLPGRKQVFRNRDAGGTMTSDVIGLEDEKAKGEPLLRKVIERGKCVYSLPSLEEIRQHAKKELEGLPQKLKDIRVPKKQSYKISTGAKLAALTGRLKSRLAKRQ
ncbi:MAG: nicotinate phosphoribosyltransferase [Candidatus Omnitrophica bacterium]|nr:nicotinate phosphoribosyltransferase [Candidatus Omnitrophota bacterium]